MSSIFDRRSFNRLTVGALAFTAAGRAAAAATAEEAVDVPWRSQDPHLSGNFLPVARETSVDGLRVVSGRIPATLRGAYMRNGPNPLFRPISFAYPMDGDGMIHAVYLDGGRARYRNRFVRTKDLAVEQRVGHAVYGSFSKPAPIDPKLLLPGDNPGPYKNGAFINVVRHGGRLIALNETTSSYELSMELETLGEWKAGTTEALQLGAHNRHHPRTGEMIALQYSWREPWVRFHRIDKDGTLVKTITVPMAMPTMVHDFVLTERYIVLIAGPAVFDREAARAGKPMLQWRPRLGTRIAVIPLDGEPVRWIEGDPFFVFHFGNGFERGDRIIVDYVHHDSFGAYQPPGNPPSFRRLTIDLTRESLVMTTLSDLLVEFPRVNERREALPTRYVYMPTRTNTLKLPNPPSAVFNAMLKFDTEKGTLTRHDFGNQIVGEGAFVPRPGATREDDGYIAAFVFDPVHNGSSLVLLHANEIEAAPAAVIQMPQRVPQGLHGNWIPRA